MKSATGLTGSGSRDWFIQRVSAVVLRFIQLLFWLDLLNGGFSFEQWYGFMMTAPMKICLCWPSYLLLHFYAWIGMWQVFTDYVTTRQMGPSASGLRLVLTSAVIIAVLHMRSGQSRFLGELIGIDHGRY